MTLRIEVKELKTLKDVGHHFQLEVIGSRAGHLISEPVLGIEPKWNPRFRVDCSEHDNIEFLLYNIENQRKVVAIGGFNCSKFIEQQGADLDPKKPAKFEVDLKVEQQSVGILTAFILYNPHQIFQGQICEKINLSLKTKKRVSSSRRKDNVIEKKESKEGTRYQYQSGFTAHEKPSQRIPFRSQIPSIPVDPHFSSDSFLHQHREHSLPMSNSARKGNRQYMQEYKPKSRIQEQNSFHELINHRDSYIVQDHRKDREKDVKFYVGKCQTVNAFSCMDEAVTGQHCYFTQSVLKQQ